MYPNPVDTPTHAATRSPSQSVNDELVSHIPLNTVVEKAPKAIQTCENDIQRATMSQSSSTHGREGGFGGRDVDGLQWNTERNAVLLCFQSRPPPIFLILMQIGSFVSRHLGPREEDQNAMLRTLGAPSLNDLIERTVPGAIRLRERMSVSKALTESEYLEHIDGLAAQNTVFRNYIGMGYHPTEVPSVIRRNVLENPGWYTAYTPYQAEIAQGRLEALLNFQTMAMDLTGMEVANASLLDEGTAAA